jgi:hypothetical protein
LLRRCGRRFLFFDGINGIYRITEWQDGTCLLFALKNLFSWSHAKTLRRQGFATEGTESTEEFFFFSLGGLGVLGGWFFATEGTEGTENRFFSRKDAKTPRICCGGAEGVFLFLTGLTGFSG